MRKVARFGGCGTVSPQACADASLLRYRPRKSVFTSDEVSAFNASIDAHKDAFKERTGDLRNSKLHTPLAGDGPSALSSRPISADTVGIGRYLHFLSSDDGQAKGAGKTWAGCSAGPSRTALRFVQSWRTPALCRTTTRSSVNPRKPSILAPSEGCVRRPRRLSVQMLHNGPSHRMSVQARATGWTTCRWYVAPDSQWLPSLA